jgi:hypothetical protein
MSDALKLEHTAKSLIEWTKYKLMAIGSMRRLREKDYKKSWDNVREAHDYLRFLDLAGAPLEPSEPNQLTLENEIAALQSVSSFLADYLKITPAHIAEPDREYSKKNLRTMTRLSDSAITKFTRIAGVSVPAPGVKNHRYTVEETCKILAAIRDGTQSSSAKRKCEKALSDIRNPA